MITKKAFWNLKSQYIVIGILILFSGVGLWLFQPLWPDPDFKNNSEKDKIIHRKHQGGKSSNKNHDQTGGFNQDNDGTRPQKLSDSAKSDPFNTKKTAENARVTDTSSPEINHIRTKLHLPWSDARVLKVKKSNKNKD